VTAVTTAGLLAGLFGSAFVPAARAAALTADDTNSSLRCTTPALDADVVSQGLADGTCYVLAGKTVTIDVDVDDGTDTSSDTFAAGATVNAPVGGEVFAEYDAEYASVLKSSNSRTLTYGLISAAGATGAQFQVAVKSHATAGSSYTYTLKNSAGTTIGSLILTSVAAGTAGVANATESSATAVCTAGTGGAALVAMGGATCAVSQIASIAASAIFSVNLVTEDAYGAVISTAGYVTATLTGTATGGIGLETDGDCTSFANSTSTTVQATPDGADAICFLSDGTPGTAKIVITRGPLVETRNLIVQGAVASIEIDAPSNMVSDGGLENNGFEDGLSVTCKDSAGNVYGDGGGVAQDGETAAYQIDGVNLGCGSAALTFTVLDGADSSAGSFTDLSTTGTLVADHVAGQFTDDAVGTVAAGSEARNGYWDIPASVCAAGKEGETRKIKVTAGLITSNTETLTCVSNTVKITGITVLTTGTSGSATGGAVGQTIKYSVAATDGYGRAAGVGASFTFTTTNSWTTAGTQVINFSNGTGTGSITLPSNSGVQYRVLSATDADQVTLGAQGFSEKISFTVTNQVDALVDYVLTKSGAKVTGSNFASRATVKIEVENASKGTVKVYSRKANAAGKVVYTVAGRGTFYVTMYTGAAGAEVLSNTVTVKR
jgi:hypothetical protein